MSEESNLLRVAIDTNNVISGTISPNSPSSKIISSWFQGKFNWIQTQETFNELKEVLDRENIYRKYHIDKSQKQSFLENLSVGAEFINPIPYNSLPIHCRDPKDDKFLACALGGNCDYLITGDDDLLTLNGEKVIGKLQIVKTVDFVQKL